MNAFVQLYLYQELDFRADIKVDIKDPGEIY
jgi:hypothetical protein